MVGIVELISEIFKLVNVLSGVAQTLPQRVPHKDQIPFLKTSSDTSFELFKFQWLYALWTFPQGLKYLIRVGLRDDLRPPKLYQIGVRREGSDEEPHELGSMVEIVLEKPDDNINE